MDSKEGRVPTLKPKTSRIQAKFKQICQGFWMRMRIGKIKALEPKYHHLITVSKMVHSIWLTMLNFKNRKISTDLVYQLKMKLVQAIQDNQYLFQTNRFKVKITMFYLQISIMFISAMESIIKMINPKWRKIEMLREVDKIPKISIRSMRLLTMV